MKFTLTKIIILALTALFGISVFTTTLPTYADNDSSICNQSNIPDSVKAASGCPGDSNELKTVIGRILNSIIGVSSFVAVIFIVIGGVQYMTSGGDPGKVQKAKDTILYACIGLVICALAFAIVNFTISLMRSPSDYNNDKDGCTNAGYTYKDGKCT